MGKRWRSERLAAFCTNLYQAAIAGNYADEEKKRNKPERLSQPGLPRSKHQRTLRLHPRKKRLNSGLCRFPSHDLDHEPKVIPSSSVRVQVLVDHLPPSPPQSFATAIAYFANELLKQPLMQQEGKFRKVWRRNRCKSVVKKGGEHVEFHKVYTKLEPPEDSVVFQVDFKCLSRSPVG